MVKSILTASGRSLNATESAQVVGSLYYLKRKLSTLRSRILTLESEIDIGRDSYQSLEYERLLVDKERLNKVDHELEQAEKAIGDIWAYTKSIRDIIYADELTQEVAYD